MGSRVLLQPPDLNRGGMMGRNLYIRTSFGYGQYLAQKKFVERQALNSSNAHENGPMRRRNLRGYDPDTMPGLVPSCEKIRDGDASFFVSDIGLGDSANSDWFGNNI